MPGGTEATFTESGTHLLVERRAGRSEISRLESRSPMRLRALPASAGCCRVAIVQTAAMLLAGDEVRLDVEIGPGASCELQEISATVAHPAGAEGSMAMHVRLLVAEGASLVLREQPLVLAAGTRVRRTTAIELAADARLSHRELLVLGRHGEQHGRGELRTRVMRAGAPLYDDTVDTRDEDVVGSTAVFGSARVLGSHAIWGAARATDMPGALMLGRGEAIMRVLAENVVSANQALDEFETAAASKHERVGENRHSDETVLAPH